MTVAVAAASASAAMAVVLDVRNGRVEEVVVMVRVVEEVVRKRRGELGYNDAFVYHKLGYTRRTLEMW